MLSECGRQAAAASTDRRAGTGPPPPARDSRDLRALTRWRTHSYPGQVQVPVAARANADQWRGPVPVNRPSETLLAVADRGDHRPHQRRRHPEDDGLRTLAGIAGPYCAVSVPTCIAISIRLKAVIGLA